ncbi:MAG: TetR/AcrR family transcriptional regulator [Lachnospiraceae bacterium]|nr:TetR/AcrR family transcriptional regulator [Lachnospiraceae bacterium]
MEYDDQTILEKKNVLRLNNAESNRLTRECLTTALMQLMKEKPIDRITITELVERAGVSRTAFYRNYATKEDILASIREQLSAVTNEFLSKPELKEDEYMWFKECFKLVRDRADVIRPILGANILLGDLFNSQSVLDTLYPSDDRMSRYRNLAMAAAFQKILITWVEEDMIESVDEMAAFCKEAFQTPV